MRRAGIIGATAVLVALALPQAAPAGALPCTITGTAAGEKLGGTPGNDVICGLGGNDRINGKGGNDDLLGGAGNDELIGGDGVDLLDGGDDFDTANYGGASQTVDLSLSSGVSNDGRGFAEQVTGVERVEGARNQQNVIIGDDGPNKLIGGLLADTIMGQEGADLVRGEPERASSGADDIILGGDDADVLFPGLGANEVFGDAGTDTVDYSALGVADEVNVFLDTGDGFATGAVDDDLEGIENVTGTPNADEIVVLSNGTATLVRGRDGDDDLSTDDGDSLDTIDGGGGADDCSAIDGDATLSC